MSEHPTRQRVALVTGSSRGLGAMIAARLARDGRAVEVAGAIRAAAHVVDRDG